MNETTHTAAAREHISRATGSAGAELLDACRETHAAIVAGEWRNLEYKSPTAYLQGAFDGPIGRVPADLRHEAVAILSAPFPITGATGTTHPAVMLPSRAVAWALGLPQTTVARQLSQMTQLPTIGADGKVRRPPTAVEDNAGDDTVSREDTDDEVYPWDALGITSTMMVEATSELLSAMADAWEPSRMRRKLQVIERMIEQVEVWNEQHSND